MTKDEELALALKALRFARDDGYENEVSQEAITAIKQARSAPVQETPFQIGQRLRQEGKGISDLWGAVSSDADMPEAQRGFDTAAPVQDLPFGVGGGLVAIKTLLSRDPCVHANTAIEMIDAILKEHPAAQPAPVQVSPLEFVTMVMEKEHLVGKPLFWAEWPNKEKNT